MFEEGGCGGSEGDVSCLEVSFFLLFLFLRLGEGLADWNLGIRVRRSGRG